MFKKAMSCKFHGGSPRRRLRTTRLSRLPRKKQANAQAPPVPSTPGITSHMVREHARRLFRDRWQRKPLSPKEWLLAERDLVRMLEADAL